MSIGQQGIIAASGVLPGKTIFGSTATNNAFPVGAGQQRGWGVGLNQDLALSGVSVYGTGASGTISDIQVPWIQSNGTSGGTAISVAVAGPLGAYLSLSIPTGTVAYPYYSSAQSAANTGLGWVVYNGAASGTIQMHTFTATLRGETEHVQLGGSGGTSAFATASATRYLPLSGYISFGTVQAQAEIKASVAGTIRRWSVYVTTNARSTTTIFTLTVNGVGVATINAWANTTGFFSAVASVVINAGDRIGVSMTTGTGTGNIVPANVSYAMSHAGYASNIWLNVGQWTLLGSTTAYASIFGLTNSASAIYNTLTPNEFALRFNARIRTPQVYVPTNSLSVAQTWTLMVNGVASAVSITVPSLTTGWVTGTGSVDVLATDLLAWRFTTPAGSGSATTSQLGLQIEYTSG